MHVIAREGGRSSIPETSAVQPSSRGVHTFAHPGTKLSVDLVVCADGPHSAVRRLVFGPEEQFVKPLGGYNAWFTAPDFYFTKGWLK